MNKKHFKTILLASFRTMCLHMKHCCSPKSQESLSSMVYKGDSCIGITFTQGNTIFPFTQGNSMFPLPPLLPFTPIPASVDGKSPHITSHLVGGGIKCPFQALSPCLIQTLAGALQCSAEAVFLRHCRRNFEHDAAKTVPVGHVAHINF